MGNQIVAISQVNEEEKRQIRVQKLILEPVYAYNVLISSGNAKFKRGDIVGAHFEFVKALKLETTGKRAVFGLTKCLIIECKEQQYNCKYADSYYNTLLKSNLIDREEISELDRLKRSF